MFVEGTTGSGKTVFENKLQQDWPAHVDDGVSGVSVLVDTKGVDKLWGLRIRDLDVQLQPALRMSKKIVWDPPRIDTGIHWEVAMPMFRRFWGRIQANARRIGYNRSRPRYLQVIVDEADRWEGTYVDADDKQRRHPPVLHDMAARIDGLGGRLVYATQYPAGLQPDTRTNLNTRVAFNPGLEGWHVLEQWRWPLDTIRRAVSVPHGFASYCEQFGWRAHAPLRL